MWWRSQGENLVSVKSGAALNADENWQPLYPWNKELINRQEVELQNNGATIQGQEAEIQRLREHINFMDTHQDRSFVGSDTIPIDPRKGRAISCELGKP